MWDEEVANLWTTRLTIRGLQVYTVYSVRTVRHFLKTGVINNVSLLINPCPKSTTFLLFEYYMEKPVLEAITYIFNIPTNQKVPLIQQTVSVLFINIASRFFGSKFKHKKI